MIKIIKNTGDTEQFVLISVPGIILSVILLTLSEMRPHADSRLRRSSKT